MQHSLATRCGLNFGYISYLDSIGKKFELNESIEDIKWLYMFEDIISAFYLLVEKQLTIKDILLSFRGAKEYAIYNNKDLLPFLILSSKTLFGLIPLLMFNKNNK